MKVLIPFVFDEGAGVALDLKQARLELGRGEGRL
jgi:hypothetical protein